MRRTGLLRFLGDYNSGGTNLALLGIPRSPDRDQLRDLSQGRIVLKGFFSRVGMNGYNFTERVRKVLMLARKEAGELHHEYVGTEHILLGICREGGGVANAALSNLEVQAQTLRESVLETIKPGLPGSRVPVDLPYTSRAKKVLELAMSEARENHHAYVGTEHLLLGLLLEERGIAAQLLTERGLTPERLRAEVLRLLGGETKSEPMPVRRRPAELQAAITLIVEHPDGRIEAKKFRRAGDAVSFLNELEY